MLLSRIIVALSCATFVLSVSHAQEQDDTTAPQPTSDVIAITAFDTGQKENALPNGWQEIIFDSDKVAKKSHYKVIRQDDKWVFQATTDGGASILYKKVDIDPVKFPYVSWRWRIDRTFNTGNEKTRAGDDYPARLLICFRYDPARAGLSERATFELVKRRSKDGQYPPLYMLNYVWANALAQNTWITSPWEDRSKIIAVRSGDKNTGSWQREIRDYARDFQEIVGQPPTHVSMIGIMIDGDGSGSSGTSYFDSIEFRASPPQHIDVGTISPVTENVAPDN